MIDRLRAIKQILNTAIKQRISLRAIAQMWQCNLRTMTQQGNSNCAQYASGDCTQWNKQGCAQPFSRSKRDCIQSNKLYCAQCNKHDRALQIGRYCTQRKKHDCAQTSKQYNAIARNQQGMIVRKQAVEQNDNHASALITGNNKEQILWKFKQQIINCQT